MSKLRNIAPVTLPLGAAGLNLTDPPVDLAPGELTTCRGYLSYQYALRAFYGPLPWSGADTVRPITPVTQVPGSLFKFIDSSGDQTMILVTDSKIWEVPPSSASIPTPVDITNSLTWTDQKASGQTFNTYLFLCNGTDSVIRVDSSPISANPSFTGPSPDDSVLTQVSTYKSRLYFVEKDSNSIWYGDVDAITGALTEVDYTTIFNDPSTLLFATNWSFTNGISNEEFFVLVSASGEVLIYSGDSPEAPNWEIVNRTRIAAPISKNSFVKFGGDILIYTVRGIVQLSTAVANQGGSATEFVLSEKLTDLFIEQDTATNPERFWLVVDEELPFLYCTAINQAGVPVLLCMNYRTGAWSEQDPRFNQITWEEPYSIAFVDGELYYATEQQSDGDLVVNRCPRKPPTTGTGATAQDDRAIETGWINFGSPLQKRLAMLRLYSSVINYDTDEVTYTLTVKTDFSDTGASQSKTLTAATYSDGSRQIFTTEFAPGAVGIHYKILLEADQGAFDEVYKMELFFEQGGAH